MATNIQKWLDDYLAAWNSHDVEKIASFFTDECVYEDVALGKINRGKEELKAFITATFNAIPDFKLELKSSFSAGEWMATEGDMSGKQAGEYFGIPATGKRFSVRGASILELRGGMIRRNSDYYNGASVLQQVGLLPTAPPNWFGRFMIRMLMKRA